jgi:hypothetical protein
MWVHLEWLSTNKYLAWFLEVTPAFSISVSFLRGYDTRSGPGGAGLFVPSPSQAHGSNLLAEKNH